MNSKWPFVSLGELIRLERRPVQVKPDRHYQEIGIYCFGRGIFHKPPRTGLEVADKDLYELCEDDLILQVTFAWEGAIALCSKAEHGLYGSTRYPTFRVDEGRCFAPFLVRYLGTREGLDQINKICPGSAGRNRVLSLKRIHEVKVPLPAIPEQRRIVARIEELAAKINEACRLRGQAAKEAASLASAAARRRIGSLEVKQTPLSAWLHPEKEGIQTGPFGAQLSRQEFTETGRPLLTIGNIQYGGLATSDLKFVSEAKAHQLSRYEISMGDVLFARMGTVGRCCVVPHDASGWLINYHIIRVAVDQSRVDPRFIHWTIQASPDVEEYLNNTIQGATREGVNSRIVAGLPCRVPSLCEQRRVIADLDALQAKVETLKTLQAETAAELDALLPSILDRTFKGDL